MLVVGPQTLNVGAVNSIVDPAQTGNPSVAVQIQNDSPYDLSVLAEGDVYSIQAFFAQTIPVAGGVPIQITPVAQSGTSAACTVTLVFLLGVAPGVGVQLPGGTWIEAPPQQDGTLTAQALTSILNTISVQGSVDILSTGNYNQAGAGFAQFNFNNLSKSYDAIVIAISPTSGANPIYAVVDTWTTINQTNPLASGAAFGPQVGGAGGPFQAVVPGVNPQGSGAAVLFSVLIRFNAASAGTYRILGVVGGAGLLPLMRSDGRAHPLGRQLAATTIAAAGTSVVIAAPAAGQSIMLKTLALFGFTVAGATIQAIGTIGGTNANLAGMGGGGAPIAPINWPDGLLLDPATNLSLVYAGAAGAFGMISAIYDLVV